MNAKINGALLKQRIKQAGYTLDEFSRELGIAKTTWYYYRSGVRSIPHQLRERIEELLDCPFSEFSIPKQEPHLRVLPAAM